jgi:hypothetical protein
MSDRRNSRLQGAVQSMCDEGDGRMKVSFFVQIKGY